MSLTEDQQLREYAADLKIRNDIGFMSISEALWDSWPDFDRLDEKEQGCLRDRVYELFHSAETTVKWEDEYPTIEKLTDDVYQQLPPGDAYRNIAEVAVRTLVRNGDLEARSA